MKGEEQKLKNLEQIIEKLQREREEITAKMKQD